MKYLLVDGLGYYKSDTIIRLENQKQNLLEALEQITDVYCKRLSGGGWNPDLDPDVIKSRAAIAAAKGE